MTQFGVKSRRNRVSESAETVRCEKPEASSFMLVSQSCFQCCRFVKTLQTVQAQFEENGASKLKINLKQFGSDTLELFRTWSSHVEHVQFGFTLGLL